MGLEGGGNGLGEGGSVVKNPIVIRDGKNDNTNADRRAIWRGAASIKGLVIMQTPGLKVHTPLYAMAAGNESP